MVFCLRLLKGDHFNFQTRAPEGEWFKKRLTVTDRMLGVFQTKVFDCSCARSQKINFLQRMEPTKKVDFLEDYVENQYFTYSYFTCKEHFQIKTPEYSFVGFTAVSQSFYPLPYNR